MRVLQESDTQNARLSTDSIPMRSPVRLSPPECIARDGDASPANTGHLCPRVQDTRRAQVPTGASTFDISDDSSLRLSAFLGTGLRQYDGIEIKRILKIFQTVVGC